MSRVRISPAHARARRLAQFSAWRRTAFERSSIKYTTELLTIIFTADSTDLYDILIVSRQTRQQILIGELVPMSTIF